MSRDSVVPTALIRQLQISLRDDLALPSSDPTPFPTIQDAVASLDPSLDSSARCGRCRGGLLCGDVSRLCVYCGEGFKGGVGLPPDISFVATSAYKLLLESLRLDGSEAVNLDPESAESNKDRDASKAGMILSDLLDLKLAFSPITLYATGDKTETKGEAFPTTFDLNLSGIDLDAVFKETKKETSQIRVAKVNQNQVPSGNQTTVVSSFAKWEPDFQSQPVNPSTLVQISAPASENFSNTNLKKETPEIESQADDEFDEWQDFAGLRASQNMSDSVENAGSSIESRESLKGVESSFNSKDVDRLGLDQSMLSGPEEITKTFPKDEFPIESGESLHAGQEDLLDDWKAFTSSGGGEQGLSESGVKPELGLTEQVSGKNLELLNHENDLFDDWKNFTGPGVAESEVSALVQKTAPTSDDLFTVNRENEAPHTETTQADVDDSFDEWNDFAGSGLGQSRSPGLKENSETSFWDPLHATEGEKLPTLETKNVVNGESSDDMGTFMESATEHIDFLGPEEKSQPITQEQSTADEIKPSARTESTHVEFSDSFDDWNDFTAPSAVQVRLAGEAENAQTISGDPLQESTTEKPSINIETSNAGGNGSFNDWRDFTRSSAEPFNNGGTSNASANDSFDDWNDFTTSSAVQGGLPDAEEKNEPAVGNSSEISNVWPIGGAETKDGATIDLWSAGVNGETKTSVSNNGDTDLSNGWLDFMSPSQVHGTVSVGGVKINNMDISSSDNWLDFARLNGSINMKSENLNLEKKDHVDLFNEWNAFTGSSQSIMPNSNIIEKNSEVGDPKHGDLSDDWLGISGSVGLRANPELKTDNNGVNDGKEITNSDDWSDFTGMNDFERPESSDDWQAFTSTGPVVAPLPSSAQDIDFGDFIQSSSSAAPTDHVHFDSLTGAPSDPLSFFSTPSNDIQNLNSNPNVNSKTGNATDIHKLLSQMSDLSFMLKDELSIPDKLNSK